MTLDDVTKVDSTDSTNVILSLIQSGNQVEPPYKILQDFFQSINQTNLITQAGITTEDFNKGLSRRNSLLETAYKLIHKNSLVYNWLPCDYYFYDAKLCRLECWLVELNALLRKNLNNDETSRRVQEIYNEYVRNFNPEFQLPDKKIKAKDSELHLSDEKLEELYQHKLGTIEYEKNFLVERMAMLVTRKANIPPESHDVVDILENLVLNHDLLESDFLNFIDNELNNVDEQQQVVNAVIFL